MPTILQINGWRLYFYAEEGNEPPHVHATKASMEAKFWLKREEFDIREEFAYELNPRERRALRKIILENFDYILEKWDEFEERKSR